MSEDRPTVSEAHQDLIDRLRETVTRLRSEQGDTIPAGEPYLASGSRFKGAMKRGVFRVTRPATRRSDRVASELAASVLELAEHVSSIAADVERIHGDIDRLDRAVHEQASGGGQGRPSDQGPPRVDDAYYWAFEGRMRGEAGSVVERLRQYERFAVPLRERHVAGPVAGHRREPDPLWLDLGCGLGEFCELVREWGFRAQGVDSSPGAVDACRAKGIDATLAEVDGYLETRRDEPPVAVSAIQLIEHLPRGRWIELFRRIHALLRPGGAMLIETINGMNPEAVTAYFVADVTHTWPGHPETLRLMAEHAGFADVEVVFLNPDERGNAQDFAIWGLKADGDRLGETVSS
ncbi:MAG: class I SAM-dependent methyltransferase [Actinomycetota bacterium]